MQKIEKIYYKIKDLRLENQFNFILVANRVWYFRLRVQSSDLLVSLVFHCFLSHSKIDSGET
jgi:hypothetical protein